MRTHGWSRWRPATSSAATGLISRPSASTCASATSSSASMPSRLAARFSERFAGEPELWARAPGRVDLMGSHTDYNLGYVLTLPISRDTWIAARRRDDPIVRVYTMNLDEEDEFRLDAIVRIAGSNWCNYVRGVAATLQDEGFGPMGDRKSTRLNSSHLGISYAV